ncbi:UDP-2,3-diacylglucosamine diphosphatase [Acidimangrovimonas pyrenivorans]|uniref:UDP-2,3-diacylglucosamine diphosphatase n=1 Tax=Acidimangrovimonas pyrenivorans TaxID=2030798 RepID=A0ABV7ADX0_9RHOB
MSDPSDRQAPEDTAPARAPGTRRADGRRHHRSLFVSDLHMGARGCRADLFLEFLEHNDADTIYLVGDIFDNWQPMGSNWTPTHDAVIQAVMARADEGARIVYLPGNHDAFFRRHYGTYFDRIEVTEQAFHIAADGRRYLVLHGDCCDVFMRRARWLSRMAAQADGLLRGTSNLVNRVRRLLGMDELIFIERAILRFNTLIRYGNRFEKRLARLAADYDQDGVICGHYHKPALHNDFGVIYANCGDWIDSFTAIAENADGGLQLLRWRLEDDALPAEGRLGEAEDAPPMAT